MTADVIHNPETDWCACEPYSANRCDYRMLADTVIERLNPPDGDAAEVDICETAIANIANYVESLPCTCTPGHDEPCGRCAALGQRHRGPAQR
jgi:hypothetical protein